MGPRELTILNDYLCLWTKSMIEFLDKLRDTSPDSSGLLAEIFYWRDISRVLDALATELKFSYVEITLQIMIIANNSSPEVIKF